MRTTRPTYQAKAAAHDFYAGTTTAPTQATENPNDAFFRAEAGLPPAQYALTLARVKAFAEAGRTVADDYGPSELAVTTAATHDHAPMAGTLTTPAAVRAYVTAGNATVTIVGKTARFTLKFARPKNHVADAPIWVRVLSGPNNEADYQMVGTFFPRNDGTFHFSAGKHGSTDAPSSKAAQWLMSALTKDPAVLAQAGVWHEGTCGRCGRKLTVPSSIETGFGPECAGKL